MKTEMKDHSPKATTDIIDIFKQRAESVSALLYSATSMRQAYEYVVDICSKSPLCEILVEDCRKSEEEKTKKILAAPSFSKEDYLYIKSLCDEKNILCIENDLYSYLGGVNVGIAVADLGIAASGTCVLNCYDSEKRLATMISEICILILDVRNIHKDLNEIADYMTKILKSNKPSTITYITGSSRTSDIERVLTVGVHGPLELHIVLIEE